MSQHFMPSSFQELKSSAENVYFIYKTYHRIDMAKFFKSHDTTSRKSNKEEIRSDRVQILTLPHCVILSG